MENAETVESMDTKHLIVSTSRRTNLKVKARTPKSRNPRWQKSVRVTTVNKSMIGIQVQTRPHSSQIYLKWTRLDAQMRDSGYVHGKTTRNVVTLWIGTRPIWLRSGKLRSTSWWSILDVLDMSAHRGLHRKFQWWVLQTSMLWQRTTWHCNTADKKWCTGTWWRTVENESWSRSHLKWWTCANLSWALLHWNVVAWQSYSITIMIASFFETRQWIWYLTIVIPICTSFWRMEFLLAKRWWCLERVRQMTWTKKTTTMLGTREMRLEKLQLVIDEKSPMQIKPDSWIFLVRRKLQDHYVLLNRRQMLLEWLTTRHMFHWEIGVRSVLRVVDEVLRTDELWWTRQRIHYRNSRQITCSFEQWQGAKLSHVSHSWKRAVEWWSASCALGKVVTRIWRRKSCDILKLMVSSIQWSFNATKRWVSLTCVEKLYANETREQCYDLCQKQVIRATGLSKQCTDTYRDSHDATRHKIETNTGVQLSATSHAIPFAIRYAGVVLSRFTVRLDGRTPFQYLLGTPYVSLLCMFGESVFGLIPDHEVRAAKLTNRWISGSWWRRDASSDEHLVGTKHGLLKCRSVRRKPPGEQWSRRETIEARGTKWNFDVEMDSGIPGPTLEPRRDEGMPTGATPMEIPTVPPPARPPEEHVHEIQVHSNSGGGDVETKHWVLCSETPMCRIWVKLHSRAIKITCWIKQERI